jgi:hypothetical protein
MPFPSAWRRERIVKKVRRHWGARADDYFRLSREAKEDEVRQVFLHLHRLCSELAKVEAPAVKRGDAPSYLDRFTVSREQTAQRWRMRETEYRAMAETSQSEDGRQGWMTIARRAREVAEYLELDGRAPSAPAKARRAADD